MKKVLVLLYAILAVALLSSCYSESDVARARREGFEEGYPECSLHSPLYFRGCYGRYPEPGIQPRQRYPWRHQQSLRYHELCGYTNQ